VACLSAWSAWRRLAAAVRVVGLAAAWPWVRVALGPRPWSACRSPCGPARPWRSRRPGQRGPSRPPRCRVAPGPDRPRSAWRARRASPAFGDAIAGRGAGRPGRRVAPGFRVALGPRWSSWPRSPFSAAWSAWPCSAAAVPRGPGSGPAPVSVAFSAGWPRARRRAGPALGDAIAGVAPGWPGRRVALVGVAGSAQSSSSWPAAVSVPLVELAAAWPWVRAGRAWRSPGAAALGAAWPRVRVALDRRGVLVELADALARRGARRRGPGSAWPRVGL
jgi:hypothetical protein